jgi:hypothetical protein
MKTRVFGPLLETCNAKPDFLYYEMTLFRVGLPRVTRTNTKHEETNQEPEKVS